MSSQRSNKRWKTTKVNNPNLDEYRLPLNCSKKYEVMAIAWNERGSSYADGKSLSVLTENGISFSIFITLVQGGGRETQEICNSILNSF